MIVNDLNSNRIYRMNVEGLLVPHIVGRKYQVRFKLSNGGYTEWMFVNMPNTTQEIAPSIGSSLKAIFNGSNYEINWVPSPSYSGDPLTNISYVVKAVGTNKIYEDSNFNNTSLMLPVIEYGEALTVEVTPFRGGLYGHKQTTSTKAGEPSLNNTLKLTASTSLYIATWQSIPENNVIFEYTFTAYKNGVPGKSETNTTQNKRLTFHVSEWGKIALIRVAPILNGVRGRYEEWSAAAQELEPDSPLQPSFPIGAKITINFLDDFYSVSWTPGISVTGYEVTLAGSSGETITAPVPGTSWTKISPTLYGDSLHVNVIPIHYDVKGEGISASYMPEQSSEIAWPGNLNIIANPDLMKWEISWLEAIASEKITYQLITNGKTYQTESLSINILPIDQSTLDIIVTASTDSGKFLSKTATMSIGIPTWHGNAVSLEMDSVSQQWFFAHPEASDPSDPSGIHIVYVVIKDGAEISRHTSIGRHFTSEKIGLSPTLSIYAENSYKFRTSTLSTTGEPVAPSWESGAVIAITIDEINQLIEFDWPDVNGCTYKLEVSSLYEGTLNYDNLRESLHKINWELISGTITAKVICINAAGMNSDALKGIKDMPLPIWENDTELYVYKRDGEFSNYWSVSWGGDEIADNAKNTNTWEIEVDHGGEIKVHVSTSKTGNQDVPIHADTVAHRMAKFRVRPVGLGGVGQWSAIQTVTLDETAPIEAPQIIDMSVADDQVTFSWSPVPRASRYSLNIRIGGNALHWPYKETVGTTYIETVGYNQKVTVSVAGVNSGGIGPYSLLPLTLTTNYQSPHWASQITPTILWNGSTFIVSWPEAKNTTHYLVGFVYEGHNNNQGGNTTSLSMVIPSINPSPAWANAYVIPRIYDDNGLLVEQGSMSNVSEWKA